MKSDRDPLSEDNIFKKYYDVVFTAHYDENIQIPEGFIEWAARKIETSQEEFGMSPAAFFMFILDLLKRKKLPLDRFISNIKNRRILLLGAIELIKEDPALLEELLKTEVDLLKVVKKLPKEYKKKVKDTLSIIARTEIGEKQYLALDALADLIDEEPELKEFFYSLLHDWDENVRYIVLKTLAKNPDEETIRRVKSIKYDESNENNLKLIEYILSKNG